MQMSRAKTAIFGFLVMVSVIMCMIACSISVNAVAVLRASIVALSQQTEQAESDASPAYGFILMYRVGEALRVYSVVSILVGAWMATRLWRRRPVSYVSTGLATAFATLLVFTVAMISEPTPAAELFAWLPPILVVGHPLLAALAARWVLASIWR